MQKLLFLLAILIVSPLCLAEGESLDMNADNARPARPESYYYGSISVPPDIVELLSSSDDDKHGDPFAERDDSGVKNVAPYIPRGQLPKCLPKGRGYRDMKSLIEAAGIPVGEKQWVLFGPRDSRIYYCVSKIRVDLLSSLLEKGCGLQPKSIKHHAVLVSVPNQGFTPQQWTLEKINNLSPTIHARVGVDSRSGERASVLLRQNIPQKATLDYSIEPTLGDSGDLVDITIKFRYTIGEKQFISTQITASVGITAPFVVDLGSHGDDLRNYFLITETAIVILYDEHDHDKNEVKPVKINKIEGIYAMGGSGERLAPPVKNIKAETHAYLRTEQYIWRMMNSLFYNIDEENDPFGNSEPVAPSVISKQLENLPASNFYASTDKVYDIKSMVSAGFHLKLAEEVKVLINTTRSHLIVHGSPVVHDMLLAKLDTLGADVLMVKTTLHLVSVESKELVTGHWDLKRVQAHKPIQLASYSTIGRSGERAIAGQDHYQSSQKNEKTGKQEVIYWDVLAVEPTIHDDLRRIDLSVELKSLPLGKEKIQVDYRSALTAVSGMPTIVDLGHPDSPDRSLLLIIYNDLIHTNNAIYRNRMKPVK